MCSSALLSDFGPVEAHSGEVFLPAPWVRMASSSREESWSEGLILVLRQRDSLSWMESPLGLAQQKQNRGTVRSQEISQDQSLARSWLSTLGILSKKPELWQCW